MMPITDISTDLQGREIRAMTNEWLEYKAYTDAPVFLAENKQSTAFIGRFTVRMIKQNKGFSRIFTVLARGYLFHNADGTLRTDDPHERIDKAREFLDIVSTTLEKGGNVIIPSFAVGRTQEILYELQKSKQNEDTSFRKEFDEVMGEEATVLTRCVEV